MSSSLVQLCATGQSVLSQDDWTLVEEQLQLSGRELAIVKLVFDDLCDGEIATRLGISRHTVNTHFGRLYRKLDVHSRVQLVIGIMAEHRSADGNGRCV